MVYALTMVKPIDRILSWLCSFSLFMQGTREIYVAIVYYVPRQGPIESIIIGVLYLIASFLLLLDLFGGRFKWTHTKLWTLFFLIGFVMMLGKDWCEFWWRQCLFDKIAELFS